MRNRGRVKLKKVISLLLLTVYLLATGGTAFASLSCRCVAMAPPAAHSCCHHCFHGDEPAAPRAFSAPCCGNHHSTEIELYTASHADSEKGSRCVVYLLLPALATEYPQPVDPLVVCERRAEPHISSIQEAFIHSAGLRAPPVLA